MFITRNYLSRRTVLQGLGVTLGLPFLDAMVPAQTPLHLTAAAPKARFIAIEMVHGAAGSTAIGRSMNYWSPAQEGRDFAFTKSLQPLEPLRDYITVVSNTELHNAMSLVPEEDGPMADHARSSAVFLTAAHPRRTAGGDIHAGPSIDQIYARAVGRDTWLPSMQLCIEDNSVAGECGYGYSCSYTHTISWASPTTPLPMERSPRRVFNSMFAPDAGNGQATGTNTAASILDSLSDAVRSAKRRLGVRDRTTLADYLDDVRAIEKRIQEIERRNATAPKTQSSEPLSVPDSFNDHVDLMFDLQLLALTCDLTRVITFKMGADRSQRIFPESGVTTPFHTLSHHRESPEKIEEFARLNQYHVGKAAQFIDNLRWTKDGDGNLLDHSLVLYGSPMGDSHVHEHRFLPLFLAGKANGALQGNRHVVCPADTPMANVLLTVVRRLGVDAHQIGDSTGEIAL
ncbi:DUF1552 domain-containing protein [Terriglobus albidus]|uniref:DUF1552 domain-containing protein n=1 Tax=Terriglobus albidus TaxID=1592106 RepID=UPI0021E080A4|nr:DUF1552 domain-containing protein [Terriglobus albidus]